MPKVENHTVSLGTFRCGKGGSSTAGGVCHARTEGRSSCRVTEIMLALS
jgi:hypothetical protein